MSSNFINRELSWLAFNKRVLEEAFNEPSHFRESKFFRYIGSNLDEFFMVRVVIKGQIDGDIFLPSIDDLLPEETMQKLFKNPKDLKRNKMIVGLKLDQI